MGLFKTKKCAKSASAGGGVADEERACYEKASVPTIAPNKKSKKLPFLKKRNKNHPPATGKSNEQEVVAAAQQQQRDSHNQTLDVTLDDDDDADVEPEDEDLGDVPRSISTPSRDGEPLPPLPPTPSDGVVGGEERSDDHDSLGSPCEKVLRSQHEQDQRAAAAATGGAAMSPGGASAPPPMTEEQRAAIAELQAALAQSPAPAMENLPLYIDALSPAMSPDPSSDLPSRALRCLFALSEASSNKQQRIDMVRGVVPAVDNSTLDEERDAADEWKKSSAVRKKSLAPALLSFLKRCPRDSSEQYLALLVLNNLSIPVQNKRPIALEHGGMRTLGRLLCEDPGCHLLVIIIVNLTFGDERLNRDLLTMSTSGATAPGDDCNGGEELDRKERSFVSCGGEVQLVDSLGYALLVSMGDWTVDSQVSCCYLLTHSPVSKQSWHRLLQSSSRSLVRSHSCLPKAAHTLRVNCSRSCFRC